MKNEPNLVSRDEKYPWCELWRKFKIKEWFHSGIFATSNYYNNWLWVNKYLFKTWLNQYLHIQISE